MRRLTAVLVVAVAALVGCGDSDDGDGGGPAEPGAVDVVDNSFQPKETTVAAGDTVTWTFKGNAAHNVSGEGFQSDLISEGEFEHTFDEAGEYDYVCTVHPGMEGTVVVE